MHQPTNIRNDQHTSQPTYQPTNIPTDKQDKRSTNHRAAYRPTNISDRHTNPTTRVLTNQQSTDETTGGICTKKTNKQTNTKDNGQIETTNDHKTNIHRKVLQKI